MGEPSRETGVAPLHRERLRLPDGDSLDTDGTFFVSADWPRRLSFLGYSGLMDSIRFAVDPLSNDFYFG
jgi:hypothetical protein